MSPTWRAATGPVGRLQNGLPHCKSLQQLNAFISLPDVDLYNEAASQPPKSCFFQNVIAVKDNIATARYPTTCGSKILQNYRSPFEATTVSSMRKSRKAKRQVLGKTNMDEFGMGSHSTNSFFGPVLGIPPLGEHSVGGSSGGSAVAVSTRQVRSAIGTDTGGSVRLPAAYTGIVGYKPSYGLISRWGVVPYANSLDTVGLLGSETASLWPHLANQMLQSDARDPTSLTRKTTDRMKEQRKMLSIESGRVHEEGNSDQASSHLRNNFGQLKIGIPVEYNIEELEPPVRMAWEMSLKIFQSQGCTLVPISLPNTKHALSAYYVIAAAEAASNLSKYDGIRYGSRAKSSDGAGDVLYSKTRGEGFGDEVKRRILLGSYSLSSEAVDNYFIKAQKVRRLVQRDFDRVFSIPNLLRPEEQFDLSDMDESVLLENKLGPPQVDFIVCPTAPRLPPTRDTVAKQSSVDSYMNDVFTVPSSLAGLPAITLPFKVNPKSKNKPSVGIQIIGQYSDDFRLLVTARAVEMLQSIVYKKTFRKYTYHSTLKKYTSFAPDISKEILEDRPLASQGSGRSNDPISDRVVTISKYLSDDPRKDTPVRKRQPETIIRKHISPKGDNPSRQPRTDKEIRQSIEDAFEDWDDMVSGKR